MKETQETAIVPTTESTTAIPEPTAVLIKKAFAENTIRPRSRGGSDAPDNLQLLCAACNSTKWNRTQGELIQSLREQRFFASEFMK